MYKEVISGLILFIYVQKSIQIVIMHLIQNKELGNYDPIGIFADIIDRFAMQSTHAFDCSTTIIKLGELEAKIGRRPRGLCPHCCSLKQPKKYIRLFFANKETGENMVELKSFNKTEALKSIGVNNNISTILYIHGFSEYASGPLPKKVLKAYLSRPEEYNIFIADWGELCAFPWYSQAVVNVKIVAKMITDFILFYSNTGELSIAKLHLVGFSLGAHICGFIGKGLMAKEKVPRITALDPARPTFITQDSTQQLSKDDAEYVDVIHTDGGKLGMSISVGHVDFYPNGGTYMQPGCSSTFLAEHLVFQYFVTGTCSHFKAVDYYVDSVKNPKTFQAYRCKQNLQHCKRQKFAYMGFGADKKYAMGDLYLTTNPQLPYGKSAVK